MREVFIVFKYNAKRARQNKEYGHAYFTVIRNLINYGGRIA